ncbi:SDR family oxidoreductase [Bacillus salipaludis]|uniref:SDR family oxidoreductase n=1 Tax=Bacillus salipaludis TaxID=2547811 RepID=A0AA90QYN9_9BACI|nr:SDR family oxidoreductase [Bacillus salipaludis]MDQ6598659.1 SDR family oxidoreductase [Bacillus salipaludis]
MKKKTAIVTGSSSGFGLLSVIELALKGFTVIATMRDMTKSKQLLELAKEKQVVDFIHVHLLDVTLPESINAFKSFLSEWPSIDVLVNNAGFAVGGFSEELSIEDYRKQFETNFFGVIAVTNAVLPFMRANGRGRIINMSSISGRFGFPGLSAYSASKHALEGYSESLRLELKPLGIDVSLIEPGSYQTNIWTSVDDLMVDTDSPYATYMKSILKEIESGKADYGDPMEVAKLVAEIATQVKSPKLRYPIGKGVKSNLFLKNILPWEKLETFIVKKLKQ